MTRYYVTMTWEDFPEGGAYGGVYEANDPSAAEELCRGAMAASRETPNWPAAEVREAFEDQWETVDCFDVDEFIKLHNRFPPDEGINR